MASLKGPAGSGLYCKQNGSGLDIDDIEGIGTDFVARGRSAGALQVEPNLSADDLVIIVDDARKRDDRSGEQFARRLMDKVAARKMKAPTT